MPDSDAPIGKVIATESKPTSCSTVRFWVRDDVIIRPFDIVRIPHLGNSRSYAIITDLEYLTDGGGDLSGYVSSDFGDVNSAPQNPRLGTTIAEAEVLHNDKEIEMPIRDGASVHWADEDGIRKALGLDGLRHPIPAGYLRMSNETVVPIEFEADFLVGPEAAHLNIAGISGLATKTSYAMFLLCALQQRLADKVTQIIFNVKGVDLLRIDEASPTLSDSHKAEWAKCKLEPKPFTKVKYLYPYGRSEEKGHTQSRIPTDVLQRQQQRDAAFNYFYDVETGKDRLSLLFSDIEDPQSTMETIAHDFATGSFETWEDLLTNANKKTEKGGGSGKNDIQVGSYRKFNRLLRTRTANDIFTNKLSTDPQKRRQVTVADSIRKLRKGDVLVIDIEPLPDYLQCLVFGDVVRTIYGMKSGDEEGGDAEALGTVAIFADELNKYAPKGAERRTLTQELLNVTERGRSLGVVLFGAEQFRSGVHARILGNCGTNAYGRTSPVELAMCEDYKYFPRSYKSAISHLPQGTLLLQHAAFKTHLIKVRFPFSSYLQPKTR
jgi:hypothetical protein